MSYQIYKGSTNSFYSKQSSYSYLHIQQNSNYKCKSKEIALIVTKSHKAFLVLSLSYFASDPPTNIIQLLVI